ncbi:hypothetical protein GCM10026982_13370 [Nocardiopsis aegyptia]
MRIYRDRVAHFAHHSSTNECTRRYGGIDSADHLYAGKQVNRWLRAQGLSQRRLRFDGDFQRGGACHRVTLPATDEYPAITFEFTSHLGAGLERLLDDSETSPSTWLAKDNPPLVRRFIGEHGHALRFRMRTEGLDRVMDIGVVPSNRLPEWYPLSDFSLGPEGFAGPGLRTPPRDPRTQRKAAPARKPHPSVHAPPLVEQMMAGLRNSLDKRDRASAKHFATRLRPYLSTDDPGAVRHRTRIQELLTEATRLLGRSSVDSLIMMIPNKPVDPPSTSST